jgi:hypothetical protein
VRELNTDIRAWINDWNNNPRPYVWTKTAEQILQSISRYCNRTNASGHWSAPAEPWSLPCKLGIVIARSDRSWDGG